MTDQLDRIFVEVCFDSKNHNADGLVDQLSKVIVGIGDAVTITKNRPPRIFSDSELENRFLNLYKTAEMYRKGLEGRLGIRLQIDPRLLYLATISAFDDIERYKAYHLEKPYTDRSDAVKRSAFLTKWISRIGPFQTIYQEGDDPRDIRSALANILFSITVSTIHISIDCNRTFKLSALSAHELSYDLLYRRVNEDALLATYQKIVHILKDRAIVEIIK